MCFRATISKNQVGPDSDPQILLILTYFVHFIFNINLKKFFRRNVFRFVVTASQNF